MPEERSERHQARLAVVDEKIRSGEIADPETLEKPTAAEIAGALNDLNKGRGDEKALKKFLADARDHELAQDETGRYVMVRPGAAAPGVFAPPTAIVDQEKAG